jgi:hypothetical protein
VDNNDGHPVFAIAAAERRKRVGVITNDQGKYLVDTAFVRTSDIPAVEVFGGCFFGNRIFLLDNTYNCGIFVGA